LAAPGSTCSPGPALSIPVIQGGGKTSALVTLLAQIAARRLAETSRCVTR
jgi:hypothetical protein